MKTHEPLAPEPNWKQDNSGAFYKPNGASPATVPRAYALGFEDGALALASKLANLLRSGNQPDAIRLILALERGEIQPVRGWKTAPARK